MSDRIRKQISYREKRFLSNSYLSKNG